MLGIPSEIKRSRFLFVITAIEDCELVECLVLLSCTGQTHFVL